ncbi:MAG: hypothetical protein KDA91_19370, partial [Planctomycetaceae bacterium]|nr:hypothetical protein [Planctomycetaceae bacterium]
PVLPAADGHFIWIGKLCNLGPVVKWVNQRSLSRPLVIISDLGEMPSSSRQLGFTARNSIDFVRWSARDHIEQTRHAFAAIDVKGEEFRSRHKPPAKMLDFLASGIPVISSPLHSPGFYHQPGGLQPCFEPEEIGTAYVEAVQRFAVRVRSRLSVKNVCTELSSILGQLILDCSPRMSSLST